MDKECYVAKANEKGQVWLGLKENEYYVVIPFGEKWLVFDNGQYIATASTSYFDITSFEFFKWNNFKIGDRVKTYLCTKDGSTILIKGKVEKIQLVHTTEHNYYLYLLNLDGWEFELGIEESALTLA